VILLGASNLTVAFPLLLESLPAGSQGPVDILAALGHGRSFGMSSRVLVRELPGIIDCGLWETLKLREESAATVQALVTDIGNDLIYGASVAETLAWIETCLARLAEHQAEVVLTLLPMGSVEKLSPLRYHLTKMIFFPGKGPRWSELLQRVYHLNDELQTLGTRFGARIVHQHADWYGFDPIHIRRRQRCSAWREMLSGWNDFDEEAVASSPSWSTRLQFAQWRPAERRMFGHCQTTTQPVHKSADLTVSLF
jgi:hypothetical protein